MKFSIEQSQAISHVDGPMMVIAGPGSGKTTVITARIKNLIMSAGISPADILVITFTKAAAREMEQRFKKITINDNFPVRFGTFHSIYFWIIKTAYNLSNQNLILEEEKRKIIESILHNMSLEYENKEDIISSIISQISLVKCDMLDIDYYYSKDLPENEFRQLYKRYNYEMKKNGRFDFDDMMVMCYELLSSRKDILEQCRNLFKYIMVDEFQDSNKIQYEIFKLLAKPRNNVFIVGDDDQSIYGFRGARPEIMIQFEKDFKDTKKVFLGDNFRCDQIITAAAASVIEDNDNRFKKNLVSKSKNIGKLNIILSDNANKENDSIVDEIRKNYASGIAYENQAVIYRTNNQPRKLLYKLNQYNIPYIVSDVVPNIFEHFVIKNVLSYMQIANGDDTRATFLKVMNKPSRYISRDILIEDRIDWDVLLKRVINKDYVYDNLYKFSCDVKLIKRMRPFAALNFIRNAMGYESYLKEYCELRQLDYQDLIDLLDEFAGMIIDMKTFDELFSFIDDYETVIKHTYERKDQKGVNLLTMHSAKGLEYNICYVMDIVEGIVPYKKAKTKQEIEEERRMLYVAMTRAKNKLYLYVPKLIASKKKEPSRFIKKLIEKKDIQDT